nr:hypothetical protein [Tanacetum cinerariifolium]
MKEAVREAVQIQTDQLQDSLQRENDEFLRNIDENMKNVLKGLVKNQALVEAYEADKTILDTYVDSTILKRRREDDDQEGPSADARSSFNKLLDTPIDFSNFIMHRLN